jgi:hypothetical protein
MERVAFLIEDTGEHLGALLNPESVVMTRTAGVEPRRSGGGRLVGSGLADDPMLFTGGGRTELRFDLLFDTDLAPGPSPVTDVRMLTRPIWQLAENSVEVERHRRPPSVRFVWGRAWNIPGIVTEVAERFDRFAADGSPLRSWLRLLFVRTGEVAEDETGDSPAGDFPARLPTVNLDGPAVGTLPVLGDGAGDPLGPSIAVPPVQLGLLSQAAFGTPLLWKDLLQYNNIDDPASFAGPLAVPPVGLSQR